MLSPLQPLYLLLVVDPSTCPERLREVEAWEARSGRTLPVVVREFFTTLATIPMAPNEYRRTVWNVPEPGATIVGRVTDDEWEVSLPDLWAEYRDGSLETLTSVLTAVERATSATGDELDGIAPPSDLRGPLVYLQTDVMRQWRVFFELDGSADPPIHEHHRDRGWSTPRSFSSWLFDAFVYGCVHQDMVPYSFWGKNADLARSEAACPVQPFRNGRWLRASQGPFGAEARAALASLPTHASTRRKPRSTTSVQRKVVGSGSSPMRIRRHGGSLARRTITSSSSLARRASSAS